MYVEEITELYKNTQHTFDNIRSTLKTERWFDDDSTAERVTTLKTVL